MTRKIVAQGEAGREWRQRMGKRVVLALVLSLLMPPGVDAASKPRTRKATKAKRPAPPVAQGVTLEERVSSLANHALAVNALTSVEVREVQSGALVAERGAVSPVAPASNIKLFTTVAALELLGPEFEYRTTLSYRGRIDSGGTLRGELKVTGRGDPTIGGRFHDGNSVAVFEQWAVALKRAGIRQVDGSIVFEHGYFDTEYVHPTWPANQLMHWYEAPVGALTLQEGCVAVRVRPGKPGTRPIVSLEPPSKYFRVENTAVTRSRHGLLVTRRRDSNTIVVDGSVGRNSGQTEVFVSVVDPVRYFATVMTETLVKNGVTVSGTPRFVPQDGRGDWVQVAEYRTPLSVVMFVVNKKSQNHYAEQLLKTIGAEVKGVGSWEAGAHAVDEWLRAKVGTKPGQLSMVDGSGMSRYNRASADAFVALLRYVWTKPYLRDFLSSMPYSGEEESRLRNRLDEAPYARQVYAKTGYISGVVGLSGYVRGKSGKVYAFSFLFNDYRAGVWEMYRLQDEMLKEIVSNG
ncbi:MAG: D-alanyl-D-alanine carboxypeptidase/D-alanyl-D-alanine-endopeptidase [Acidobacteria bacterium]|nr:D-alanyl-D-alanine carboxypeptidase/D-alanyl-D-alanine-endopeptidase [Acidobacteriota bacterium]